MLAAEPGKSTCGGHVAVAATASAEAEVMERILVAEDDPAIADSVGYSLRACGYHVDVVGSGEAVLASGPGVYDLLILDVRLPGLSGVEVCRRVRERSAVPVLILTALDGAADRVVGLEAGADDYLGKPFSMAELVSRVRAILRRRRLDREPDAVRYAGGLYLDLAGQTARIGGRNIELTPSEFRVLALLAAEPGRVFTRRDIAQRLARGATAADERVCDVHVKNLRRKVEDDPARPRRLVTVRGVGYLLRAV
jgi:DNA-binding response OmpR family regulator